VIGYEEPFLINTEHICLQILWPSFPLPVSLNGQGATSILKLYWHMSISQIFPFLDLDPIQPYIPTKGSTTYILMEEWIRSLSSLITSTILL
jgi:hypothetical protein